MAPTRKDGYLYLDELKAKDKDELAFKAADINADGWVDPGEFDKCLARKATDQAKPGPRGKRTAHAFPAPSEY